MLDLFQRQIDEFHRSGAEVFGVSVDSHHSQKQFAELRGITYPVLSDLDREAMTALGVKIDTFGGYRDISNRAIVVIDRSGNVAFVDEKTPDKPQPDVDAALETVRNLNNG